MFNKTIKKIAKPTLKDKNIIRIIWLVKATPNGVILTRLEIKIKVNKVKIKGKYTKPLTPNCWSTKFNIKKYKLSINNCQTKGTNTKFSWNNWKIEIDNKTIKKNGKIVLFIDKSKKKNIGNKFITSNCSKGEYIILK